MDPLEPSSMLDVAFFNVLLDTFEARIDCADPSFLRPGGRGSEVAYGGLGYLPVLRCDRGLAKVGTAGCVFSDAAAVYVLEGADSEVKDAAEHIFEAQNNPDPDKRSPGKFLLKEGSRAFAEGALSGNALQRAKSRVVQEENRKKSCSLASSLLNTRLPLNQSPMCAASTQTCSCDEYPFASTWNNGNFRPERTSAKKINDSQNKAAGTGTLTQFYTSQRVIDYTLYPDQVRPYDPNAELNRGGDNFWVFIR